MRTLIIIVSLIAVGVTAATVIVGTRIFDGLVVEKPYETGLDWDKIQQQKKKLGWAILIKNNSFYTGRNNLLIATLDKSGGILRDTDLRVKVGRRSTAKHDKVYQAVRQADGDFHAAIDLPFSGTWEITINVKNKYEQASFTHIIHVERQ